jgi:CheY-like chemotaxis protein
VTYAILVLTPHAAFGELIRQSLARNHEDYVVIACQSSDEALELCSSMPFTIAILDTDLADTPLPALGQALQALGMRLVVFPPQNNPRSPSIAGLNAQAYLKKPFYLPALLKTINKLLSIPANAETSSNNEFAAVVKPKRTSQEPEPTGVASYNTLELLTVEPLPVGVEEEDPPEPEPTLSLAELDQVRKSWIKEAELAQVGKPQVISPAIPAPALNQADTQPIKAAARSMPAVIEETTIYTCMLTPLLPDHYLRFDLASALERWMRQASESEKWLLLSLSIRPTHMEWTVRISPGTTAEKMLSYFRDITSENIFRQFPVFVKDNPTQNFWAPEHLIQRGERSLTRQQIYALVTASHLSAFQPSPTEPLQPPTLTGHD